MKKKPINQPIVFGTKCFELCEKLNIGKWNYSSEPYFQFTSEEINLLRNKSLVFNGTNGGLILGNLHLDGGINLISYINENTFKYVGEMEGWEYLTSPYNGIDIENFENFKHINENTLNTNRNIKTEFKIPKNCNIIDLRNIETPFLLINDQQAIINRFATKKHIRRIIKIDEINYS